MFDDDSGRDDCAAGKTGFARENERRRGKRTRSLELEDSECSKYGRVADQRSKLNMGDNSIPSPNVGATASGNERSAQFP